MTQIRIECQWQTLQLQGEKSLLNDANDAEYFSFCSNLAVDRNGSERMWMTWELGRHAAMLMQHTKHKQEFSYERCSIKCL